MTPSFARRFVAPALVAGLVFTVLGEACQRSALSKSKGGEKATLAYRFSGPYTHDNLTIFLIHGADQINDKNILTLDEALKEKKVIVHETQNVNQLAIENVSGYPVFVQAGDIVRGGQQDRTIAFDMIVPPESGKLPLNAFCVEAGRWTQRGKEAKDYFSSSANCVTDNYSKIAVRKSASQRAVWENVAKKQMALKTKVNADVQAKESKSSLELTLEHKNVVEAVDTYIKKLQEALKDKNDVIGYAVVINGKVNNADVYASHILFGKMWPKLLKASAVEAVSAMQKEQKFEPASVEAVKTFLADAEKGKKTEKKVGERYRQIEQESEKSILFETKANDKPDVSLRRSHVAK
jgi:hypothetical protein